MSLFESASLVVTPNGTKASKLYAIKPTDGSGDLSVTRATTATRVNSAGLIESVASNVPRLDYTNSTCPSILVEPQRTNLLTYSEQFDNAIWQDINSSVTANVIASPSGNIDADKIVENTSTSGHTQYQAIAVTNGATYTLSVFAKSAERTRIWIDIYGGINAAVFNLSNGTIIATSAGSTSKIENYGNGWYKCSVTAPCPDSTAYINIGPTIGNTTNNEYAGNGTSGVYVYGAQLEAGSYATSYIPTTSASVTRNADVISKTGISSLIGQTEGTLFVEAKVTFAVLDARLMLIGQGNQFIEIVALQAGKIQGFVYSNATIANMTSSDTYATGDTLKIALAYKANDFVLYVNGTQQDVDSSGTIPVAMAQLIINDYVISGYNTANYYKAAALYKTRLSNSELEQLTTI